MNDQIIAKAICTFLEAHLEGSSARRHFFRLDGFDDATYRRLLEQLEGRDELEGYSLSLRTISPIPGFEQYALEPDKSATWYRNHVAPGQVLVLVFNQHTSDAQSLKDIYPVTEGVLATEGLKHLIEAAFVDYDLKPASHAVLQKFVQRIHKYLFQPQLRDLVAFLHEAHEYLSRHKSSSIEDAIAYALPQLWLFRARELAGVVNSSKGDRLLRDNYRAARLGREIIEDRKLKGYLASLEKATFEDEKVTGEGLSPQEKRHLLDRFLTDVLADRNEMLQILRIDWSEVTPVLHKRVRKTKEEKLQELAEELQRAFEEQQIEVTELAEPLQMSIQDMEDGKQPEEQDLGELLVEVGDSLPKSTRNKVRRLTRSPQYKGSDFVAGVTSLAIELLSSLEEDIAVPRVQVRYLNEHEDKAEEIKEALQAFKVLYGGIEGAISAVEWQLETLWQQVSLVTTAEDAAGEDEESEEEKTQKTDLSFQLVVLDEEAQSAARGDLTWQFRSDGPMAATLAHLQTEVAKLQPRPRIGLLAKLPPTLPIPIYNTCPETNTLGDLDLSRPVQSLGAWYAKEPTELGELLRQELKPLMADSAWYELERALLQLERAWAQWVQSAAEQGTLHADVYDLMASYEALLSTARELFQSSQEALTGFRLMTQAWIVGPEIFEDWAVVPFLHPLKLHWWWERAQQFDDFIVQLLEPTRQNAVVNESRFQQELKIIYGSARYPALLALPGRNRIPEYFLPIHESGGYELFQLVRHAGIAYGLDPELVSEEEGEQAAQVAAKELARIVQDYVETYPFVKDGLEVFIAQCRNGALPGLLVEQLRRRMGRRDLALNMIVHSEDRGAPLYQRVTEWVQENEVANHRSPQSYFPPVTFKVLETPFDDLVRQVNDTDLVVLPDVLAEKGQELEHEEIAGQTVPLQGYLPLYRVQQEPYQRGELTRSLSLTPVRQPALLHHFYAIQWAAKEHKPVPLEPEIALHLRVTLQEWGQQLADLHRHFNWVICYDTTVDRFLLEATIPEAVEVIRYSLGLGIKRRHNLTVSSAKKAQDVVTRRLTANIVTMLPHTSDEFRQQVAHHLVTGAKQVSGDIVLRAAGPGAYLNELIGMVLAKHLTEQRYRQQHPNALTTWVYLDDFAHWFDKKYPDLLFVAISTTDSDTLTLHIEVLETKCISSANFAREAVDAQQQVAQGVNRLAQAWHPGKQHLDASYWYDQLYQAMVGNLSVTREQKQLWQMVSESVPEGKYTLEMSGQTWVFCYDGTAGKVEEYQSEESGITAPDAPDVPHFRHYVGRAGVRKSLKDLIEATWKLDVPSGTWSATYDAAIDMERGEGQSDIQRGDVQEPLPIEVEEPTSSARTEALYPSETYQEIVNAQVESEKTKHEEWLEEKAQELMRTLRNYDIRVYPIEPEQADVGPSIVRFKVRLRPGQNLSRIQNIAADLQRELALESLPLVENVRGTNYVGIDIPRPEPVSVALLPALEALPEPQIGELLFLIGKTPAGETIEADLSKFPHLLVAGSTGSGKTIFLYSLITSLVTRFGPDQLSLLLIDPKQTDFVYFEELPHLEGERVLLEPEEAIVWLERLTDKHLVERTQQLREARSRDVKDYNARFPDTPMKPLVVVIDEYADLIQVLDKSHRQQFERGLNRLAQRARNVGIHLVIATQRPSADIVTTSLKANLPARIGFRLPSYHDSKTILGQTGAENLLGKGDMLYKFEGNVERLQGFYISPAELDSRVWSSALD